MRKVFLLGLFLLLIPFSVLAQSIKVTGKVLDGSTNEPLIGVNVVQAGTTNGTITDLDGKYEISVPSDSKLQFSYIGYVSQTIDVAGKSTIICTLASDDKEIEQVVVVGYGTMKKSDVSGSVVSVDTKDMMKRAPANVNQGLQGAAAGVMVTAQDGSPEGKSQVRIRGVATINGNAQPLYVVDGIQVGTDASFISPADIESMEVLKDASATAIYGSAGANGVVMITTKHGAKGKARVDFSADFGISKLAYKLDVWDVDQYAGLIREAHANDRTTLFNNIWDAKYDGKRNAIDWQDQLTQTAFKQQYNVSVAGGNEKSQTQFSASYLKNEGIIVNSAYERLTARLNNKTTLTSFLEIGGDVNYVYTSNHGSNASMGNNGNLSSQRDLAYMTPSMDYENPDGKYQKVNVVNEDGTYGIGIKGENKNEFMADRLNNPYAIQMGDNSKNFSNRVFTSAYAQLNLVKGLTFKSVAALDFSSTDYNNFINKRKRYNVDPDTKQYYLADVEDRYVSTNEFSISQSQGTTLKIENYFNYTWKNDIMNLSAMIGQEASKYTGSWVSASTNDFKQESMRDIALSNGSKNGNGAFNADVRGVSYFGRLTYGLFDKYVLTATVRRDGSSNFGEGNKFGTFPSAALAWRISQEDFLKDNEIITNLKLRLGWGQTGNSGGATDMSIEHMALQAVNGKNILYGYYNPYQGMGSASGNIQGSQGIRKVLVDTDLKWETNEQTNIGIDLGLLGGQINVTADYFIRTSKDLLIYRPVAVSSGLQSYYTNYGKIQNKGFEFMVNYQKRVHDWTFGATFTGSTIKNEVKKMDSPVYATNDGGTADPGANDGSNRGCIGAASGFHWGDHSVSMKGEAVGSYFGYIVEGIFQNEAEIEAAGHWVDNPDGTKSFVNYQYQCIYDGADERTVPGDFKYKDINGDGIINESDRTVIGNGFPKFNYGINLSVSYKNYDFSVYGYGVAGMDILSYSAMRLSSGYVGDDGCVPNTLTDNSYWSEKNKGAELPRFTILDGNRNRRCSTAWIKKGDFFKISNMQIGYTFDRNLIQHLQLTNARVYFSVSNVALFSKYKKYGDPECGQGCVLYTGLDSGRYPNPRTFQFGLSFSF